MSWKVIVAFFCVVLCMSVVAGGSSVVIPSRWFNWQARLNAADFLKKTLIWSSCDANDSNGVFYKEEREDNHHGGI